MTGPAARLPAPAGGVRRAATGARRALASTIVLLLALALAGCASRGGATGTGGTVAVHVTTHPAPATMGPARIVVLLSGPADEPIGGATVRVEGTMSHAGMVPVIRDAAETAAGQYEVDDFEFTMAGDWVLVVSGTTSAGDPISKQVKINGVRTGSPSVDQPLIPSERCYSTPTPTGQD